MSLNQTKQEDLISRVRVLDEKTSSDQFSRSLKDAENSIMRQVEDLRRGLEQQNHRENQFKITLDEYKRILDSSDEGKKTEELSRRLQTQESLQSNLGKNLDELKKQMECIREDNTLDRRLEEAIQKIDQESKVLENKVSSLEQGANQATAPQNNSKNSIDSELHKLNNSIECTHRQAEKAEAEISKVKGDLLVAQAKMERRINVLLEAADDTFRKLEDSTQRNTHELKVVALNNQEELQKLRTQYAHSTASLSQLRGMPDLMEGLGQRIDILEKTYTTEIGSIERNNRLNNESLKAHQSSLEKMRTDVSKLEEALRLSRESINALSLQAKKHEEIIQSSSVYTREAAHKEKRSECLPKMLKQINGMENKLLSLDSSIVLQTAGINQSLEDLRVGQEKLERHVDHEHQLLRYYLTEVENKTNPLPVVEKMIEELRSFIMEKVTELNTRIEDVECLAVNQGGEDDSREGNANEDSLRENNQSEDHSRDESTSAPVEAGDNSRIADTNDDDALIHMCKCAVCLRNGVTLHTLARRVSDLETLHTQLYLQIAQSRSHCTQNHQRISDAEPRIERHHRDFREASSKESYPHAHFDCRVYPNRGKFYQLKGIRIKGHFFEDTDEPARQRERDRFFFSLNQTKDNHQNLNDPDPIIHANPSGWFQRMGIWVDTGIRNKKILIEDDNRSERRLARESFKANPRKTDRGKKYRRDDPYNVQRSMSTDKEEELEVDQAPCWVQPSDQPSPYLESSKKGEGKKKKERKKKVTFLDNECKGNKPPNSSPTPKIPKSTLKYKTQEDSDGEERGFERDLETAIQNSLQDQGEKRMIRNSPLYCTLNENGRTRIAQLVDEEESSYDLEVQRDLGVKEEERDDQLHAEEIEIISNKPRFYCGDPSHERLIVYANLESFKEHVRRYHNKFSNLHMSHTSFGLPMSEESLKEEIWKRSLKCMKRPDEVFPNSSVSNLEERKEKKGSKKDEDFRPPALGRGKGRSKKSAI